MGDRMAVADQHVGQSDPVLGSVRFRPAGATEHRR
jgi:hypothetical protein